MKSLLLAVCLCGLLTAFSTTLFADTLSFQESKSFTNTYVDIDGGAPKWWSPAIDFPDAGPLSDYSNGRFEYDNYYLNNLSSFTITIKGHDDNNSQAIDFFLDFDSDHSLPVYKTTCKGHGKSRVCTTKNVGGDGWFNSDKSDEGKIAGKDVNNGVAFTLQLDIKNNTLNYYNAAGHLISTSALNYVTPATFADVDAFYLGIGCHFWLDSITVAVAVTTPDTAPPVVPEPSTIFLMGVPLIGLVAWKLKKTN
jgi:hypothetical protein